MKRQMLTTLIALVLPIVGVCQSKVSIGTNVNTQISLLTINKSQAPVGIEEKWGLGVGYSVGIQGQYNFIDKAFIRTGFTYQNRVNRHKIEGLRFPSDLLNNTESSIQNDITISSLGIPIDLGYMIHTKTEKVNYIIGMGGTININLETSTSAKVVHDQMDSTPLPSADNIVDASIWSMGIYGGLEVQLSEKLILGIEPNIRITPHDITLYLYRSKASSVESGLTFRVSMR